MGIYSRIQKGKKLMKLIYPSAGTPLRLIDIVKGFKGLFSDNAPFENILADFFKTKHCFLVNSGTTALYLILKILKKNSNKNVIVMPAYTAPSLILPIKKAGLKYKLVDISLDDFNMDKQQLLKAINKDTLAVLVVHMFGIPFNIEGLTELAEREGFHIIEDAASAMGTKLKNGPYVGTFSNIGFYSFNRGKNFSTTSGGLIVTSDKKLSNIFFQEIKNLPELSIKGKANLLIKTIGLSLAVRPWFYTFFKPFLSGFKYTTLHQDFNSFCYTGFQKALGNSTFERAKDIFDKRVANGLFLRDSLRDIDGLRLPVVSDKWEVAFNQFPFIVEEEFKRDKILEAILNTGIEATTLYDKPIHKVYHDYEIIDRDSKDKKGPDTYPKSTYLSKRLILIPTHPLITRKNLQKVVDSIKKQVNKM